ncbi:hypothetical protein ROHU_009457 [Labeo rohita]|uniref:Uncharacterized protein n=1 Tax=Labeo rohita TaxID=84645 RepID=A0A498LZQ3_LABRO|nr:hypothetical protein ROHU_009457 [Labeo rohita]
MVRSKELSDALRKKIVAAYESAPQASVSVQQPSAEGGGVSSTPKSKESMQASFQDDGNPSQQEDTPLVPPRDESLLVVDGHKQDLIEELTASLKRVGSWSNSQPSSGMSAPSYTSPHDSKKDSPQYAFGYDTNAPLRECGPSNLSHCQTDDAALLRLSKLPHEGSYPPATDPYYRRSSNRARFLQRDALIDCLDQVIGGRSTVGIIESFVHLIALTTHWVVLSYRRLYPAPMQYRGPTPTIPDFRRDDPREFAQLKLALDNVLPDDASESFKFQILLDHLKLEDALLVADSYSHSRTPFSDMMRALTDMYGQPHQLALQRITLKVGSEEKPKAGHADSAWPQERPKKYCPFCDTVQHYMNQCSNFKLKSRLKVGSGQATDVGAVDGGIRLPNAH